MRWTSCASWSTWTWTRTTSPPSPPVPSLDATRCDSPCKADQDYEKLNWSFNIYVSKENTYIYLRPLSPKWLKPRLITILNMIFWAKKIHSSPGWHSMTTRSISSTAKPSTACRSEFFFKAKGYFCLLGPPSVLVCMCDCVMGWCHGAKRKMAASS